MDWKAQICWKHDTPTDSLLDGSGHPRKCLGIGRGIFTGVVSDKDTIVLIMSILLSPAVRWTPFAHIRENDGNLNI
jgi:hypothetical protein